MSLVALKVWFFAFVACLGFQIGVEAPMPSHQLAGALSQDQDNELAKLPKYDTMADAAIAAAKALVKCSTDYECAATIAETPDEKYVVGPVVTMFSGDQSQFNFGAPEPLIAVSHIHSHPCNPSSHANSYFSPPDMINYAVHRIPGFMLDMCTGDVHEFPLGARMDIEHPCTTPTCQRVWLSHGIIVGRVMMPLIKHREPDVGIPGVSQ